MAEMGRKKIVVKRIDNLISRQVTFSKRRNRLLKKAFELSTLCDAEVGVIIFSSKGRLYEFASTGMKSIIERYQGQKGQPQLFDPASNSESKIWNQEAASLRKELECLQHQHRQLLGKELSGLSIDDLQNFESQTEMSLEAIRTRKDEILNDQINELKHKANLIYQENLEFHQKLDHLRQENLGLHVKAGAGKDATLNEGNTSSHLSPSKSSNESGFHAPNLLQLSQPQSGNDKAQDESMKLSCCKNLQHTGIGVATSASCYAHGPDHRRLSWLPWIAVPEEPSKWRGDARYWSVNVDDELLEYQSALSFDHASSLKSFGMKKTQLDFDKLREITSRCMKSSSKNTWNELVHEEATQELQLSRLAYPPMSLSAYCHPTYLVELNLQRSSIQQLWAGKQPFVNLKSIDLKHSKVTTIPDLSEAQKLNRLNLRGCKSLRSLPSLNDLKLLTTLILTDCSNLKEIPELSTSIQYLFLAGTAIEELPLSIGCLSDLIKLDLRNCSMLRSLPSSICELQHLEYLSISGCTILLELLESIS